MANGDPPVLPQLRDPATMARKARAAADAVAPKASAPRRTGLATAEAKAGPYAAVYDILRGMQDPLEKEIVRLSYQDLFRDLTGDTALRIPTEEEYAIQTQERAIQLQKLRIEGAKLRVHEADAALEGASPEVQARFGFRPGLLDENPRAWAAVANAAGIDVTMDDLMLASESKKVTLDESELAQGAQEKTAKSLSDQAGAIRNVETIGAALSDAAAGKGQIGADVGSVTQGVEALFGELSPSNLDEAGGSKGLLALRSRLNASMGATLKRQGVAHMLSSKYGKDIADQMEEAVITPDGVLDPTQGTRFISKDAAYFLSALALGIAEDTGTSFGQVVQQWGVKGVSDLDVEGFLVETQRKANAEAGGDAAAVLKDLGLSTLLRRTYRTTEDGKVLTWADALRALSGGK